LNIDLRPRKPEGSLGRKAHVDGHLDFHTAPELCLNSAPSAQVLTLRIIRAITLSANQKDGKRKKDFFFKTVMAWNTHNTLGYICHNYAEKNRQNKNKTKKTLFALVNH